MATAVAVSYSVPAGGALRAGLFDASLSGGVTLADLVPSGILGSNVAGLSGSVLLDDTMPSGSVDGVFVPTWRSAQTAQTWVEVPVVASLATLNPQLDPSINPNFPGAPEYYAGNWSFIVTAWNAGCYDKGRDEFLIPLTGGHADYAGNDYLALQLRRNSAQWVRRSKPSGWDGSVITNDQARLVSGSGNTVVLPAGVQAPLLWTGARDEASSVTGAYVGMTMVITASGTQIRTITAYDGPTRTATLGGAPLTGSVANALYAITNGPMVQGLLGEQSGRYSDGRARAVHTYNIPCFADLDDAPWMPVGGSGPSWTSSQGYFDTLRVDRVTGEHTFFPGPTSAQAASPFGGATCYDPTRGTKGSFWYFGQNGSRIVRFDIAAGTWSQSAAFSARGGEHCLTYLPGYDVILVGATGTTWAIYDPVADTLTNITVSGTPAGSNASYGKACPEYVAADNRVYWWNNPSGSTTRINYMTVPADPKTGTWTIQQTTPAGSNAVTPTAAVLNGTYGRFRYSSFLDGFLLFNSVDGPLYFYARANLT